MTILKNSGVFMEGEALDRLAQLMESEEYSKVLILCDVNTHGHCLPNFLALCPFIDSGALEIIELEAGEESKSLEVLAQLWDAFGALGLDRRSLLINLGGGVITDLGGFAASSYMRGIDFVNFPTSLLAMVDASVGSKTGINFGGFKNRIGSFSDPRMVGVLSFFLETLDENEQLSGWAEMLKHGFIADANHLEALLEAGIEGLGPELISASIAIKAKVVQEDKREGGERKILNFGHSIGHALESFYSQKGQPISHGHAVALGMQVELLLSTEISGLEAEQASKWANLLNKHYPFPANRLDEAPIKKLLGGDKKNSGGQSKMSLLKSIGHCLYDQEVSLEKQWHYLQKFQV